MNICHGTCDPLPWNMWLDVAEKVCAWLYRLRHHSVYKPGDPRKGRERCSKLSASLHSFANELQGPSVWTQLQVRVMLCLRFSLQNLAGIGRATCLVSGCFRGVIGVVATCGNLGVSGWGNSWIKTVRLQLRYLKRWSEISCSYRIFDPYQNNMLGNFHFFHLWFIWFSSSTDFPVTLSAFTITTLSQRCELRRPIQAEKNSRRRERGIPIHLGPDLSGRFVLPHSPNSISLSLYVSRLGTSFTIINRYPLVI